ncbi:hypothetical protein AAE02nite_21590 [Adhaeribacter aerolatus]|uniref:Peptidase M48 domain-containing protein n=1 Tax=Adhaeribacter aerolatus TaxID=670289 RepID=A0A512AXP3_9BACT|nr:hypothetical protein [Adhaeribacter aerolatus]GEO04495.1 hypothetical protein AAE02nite_21590 [Adhaeribacter aerolatus]
MADSLLPKVELQLNILLAGGFRDLALYRIKVKKAGKKNDFFLAVQIKANKEAVLLVDKACRKFPDKVLTGLVAHELAHIVQARQCKFYLLWKIRDILSLLSAKLESLEERDADKIGIQRGYGEEILALAKYLRKHYKSYTTEEALTIEEIKALYYQK